MCLVFILVFIYDLYAICIFLLIVPALFCALDVSLKTCVLNQCGQTAPLHYLFYSAGLNHRAHSALTPLQP